MRHRLEMTRVEWVGRGREVRLKGNHMKNTSWNIGSDLGRAEGARGE